MLAIVKKRKMKKVVKITGVHPCNTCKKSHVVCVSFFLSLAVCAMVVFQFQTFFGIRMRLILFNLNPSCCV